MAWMLWVIYFGKAATVRARESGAGPVLDGASVAVTAWRREAAAVKSRLNRDLVTMNGNDTTNGCGCR